MLSTHSTFCIRKTFSGSYLWVMVHLPVLSLNFYSLQRHERTFFPFLDFSVLTWSALATCPSILPLHGIKIEPPLHSASCCNVTAMAASFFEPDLTSSSFSYLNIFPFVSLFLKLKTLKKDAKSAVWASSWELRRAGCIKYGRSACERKDGSTSTNFHGALSTVGLFEVKSVVSVVPPALTEHLAGRTSG